VGAFMSLMLRASLDRQFSQVLFSGILVLVFSILFWWVISSLGIATYNFKEHARKNNISICAIGIVVIAVYFPVLVACNGFMLSWPMLIPAIYFAWVIVYLSLKKIKSLFG